MTDLNNAGVRLKTARVAAGFKSAREFYEKYKIPSSTYSLHETGRRNLKPRIAEKYAKLLGVNLSWLLTGHGKPYNNAHTIEEQSLSREEFNALLKYQGNEEIKKSAAYKNEILNNVNPILFSKIVAKITEVLNELGYQLDMTQLSKKAVEIYKDIISTNNEQETQLMMVDLSVTTFKRQIQEIIRDKKQAVNE